MSGPLTIQVGPYRLCGEPGGDVDLCDAEPVDGHDVPHLVIPDTDVRQLAEALLAFVVAPTPSPAAGKKPQAVECRTCGALMFWAVTPAGRRMPVDAGPTPDGTLVLSLHHDASGRPELHLETWRADEPKHAAPRNRYTSHFATCAQAAQHRRAR